MLADLFDTGDEYETLPVTEYAPSRKLQKPPPERAAAGFVGLENQGATCYLNSLIQAMYMTPELRAGIFAIDPVALGVDLIAEEEAEARTDKDAPASAAGTSAGAGEGGAPEPEPEIEVNESLLEMLTAMGIAEHQAKRALVGTQNGSMDAVFEYIDAHENDEAFNAPPEEPAPEAEAEAGVEEKKGKKKRKPRYIPLELQRLFTQLKLVEQQAVSTHELTTRGFAWQNFDGQVQHDAHELNRLLLDALERSLVRTPSADLCRDLYEGALANQIRCLGCLGVSERAEPFYDINLQIVGCEDMASSLRQHCAAELLANESMYQCDVCKGKRRALRNSVLQRLPPVLTFSCSRFKIDRSTNWQRMKVTSRSEFPLLLDMSPFLDTGSGPDVGTLEAGAGTGELGVGDLPGSALQEGALQDHLRSRMVWLSEAVAAAGRVAAELEGQGLGQGQEGVDGQGLEGKGLPLLSRYLRSLDREQYEAIARHIAPHLFPTDPTATVPTTPTATSPSIPTRTPAPASDTASLYQLHAVVMHRGSAHSGHYFAYIRDALQEGRWQPPLDDTDAGLVAGPETGVPAPSSSAVKGANPWATASTPAAAEAGADAGADVGAGAQVGGDLAVPRQYVLDYMGLMVDTDSALAVVVNAVRNVAQTGKRPAKYGNQQQGPGQTQVWVRTTAVGAEVARLLRDNWANTYKSLGSLEGFMLSQEAVLAVRGGRDSGNSGNGERGGRGRGSKDGKGGGGGRGGALGRGGGGGGSGGGSEVCLRAEVRMVDGAVFQQLRESAHKGDTGAGISVDTGAGTGDEDAGVTEGADADGWATTSKRGRRGLGSPTPSPGVTPGGSPHRDGAWGGPGTGAGAGVTLPGAFPGMDPTDALAQAQKQVSPELRREALLSQLSAELLSHFYGDFFEFNDSLVAPMPLLALEKAFEGPDSAYLLVYRRVQLPQVPPKQEGEAPESLWARSTSASVPSASTIAQACAKQVKVDAGGADAGAVEGALLGALHPPAHWAAEVQQANAQLQGERAAYDAAVGRIRLYVHCPAHLLPVPPTPLLLPHALAPEVEEDAEAVAGTPTDAEPGVGSGAGVGAEAGAQVGAGGSLWLEVETDGRCTVAQLVRRLLQEQAHRLGELQLLHVEAAAEAGAEGSEGNEGDAGARTDASASSSPLPLDLGLTLLQRFGEGWYPLETLPHSAALDELSQVPDGAHLMLWDCHSLQGQPVLVGAAGYPQQLSLSLLTGGVGGSGGIGGSASGVEAGGVVVRAAPAPGSKSTVPVQEAQLYSALHLPSTLNLLALSHQLCQLCGVDPLQACVSVLTLALPDASSSSARNKTAPSSVSARGQRHLQVSTLFSKGIVMSKPLGGAAPGSHTRYRPAGSSAGSGGSGSRSGSGLGSGSDMLMTADSALGEFPHLACVLVEHIAERGLGRVSLAERLCEQRNDEWTVTVEVDFEPAALRALLPEIESVGAGLGVGEGSGAEAGAGAGVPPCPSKSKSVSFGDSFSSLQFDIERRCSVLELKTAALRRLLGTYTDTVDGDGADVGTSRDVRLAGLLSRTRLRLGADRGQGVLQQEEALLHEAGLRDHIALYLEIGAPTPAAMVQEQLRVSVVLVVGNSRTAAYSAADQGARLGTVEVEAEPGESVAELKDRAGQMLLDYPPGWAMGAYGAGAGAGSGVRTREGLEVPLPDPVTPEDEAAAAISIAAVAADDSAHAQRASLRPPKPPGTRAKMEAETGAGAGVKREGGEGHEQETEAGTDAGADAEAGAEAEADRRVQCFSESLRLGNFRGRRLRRTSWMGEFAELLLEAEEGTGTGAGMGAGAGGGGEGGGVPGGAGKGGMKGAKRGGDGAVGAASALAAASAPASSAEPPAPAPAPPAAITLQQAGVRSGDTLLLEEGWLPVRGIMGIQVFLWSSAPAPTPAPVPAPVSDAAPVEAGEVSVVTGAVVVAGTVPEAQVQGQELEVELALELGALRETECARKACLLPLGSVELLERCSVLELQQRVGLLLGAQYGYMAGALGVVEGAGEGAGEGGEAGTGTEALGTPSLVPVPLDGFLLRELRADLLPGRSFWTCERDKEKEPEDKDSKDRDKRGGKKGGAGGAGAAKGTSAAVAGAKAGAGMAGVAAGGEAVVEEGPIPTALAGSSLRRLGLRGERGLVVELCLDPTRMVMGTAALPAQSPTPQSQSIPPPALFALSLPFLSQSQVRPPAGAFRLWAQELLNPGLGEGTTRMSPLWPPLPVLLNGGAAPTLGHLKRAVGAVFAHIPLDHLGVYKFSPQTTEWAPLVLPATLGALAASIGGRKRVGGKRESNVTQAPYFVKEGDQFCAFDCRLIPPRVAAAAAAGAGAGANLGISLAADVQLKALKDWQKAQRRSKKNQFEGRSGGGGGGGGSGGGGGAGRVVRRPEVMLSLGAFDFSDEDD